MVASLQSLPPFHLVTVIVALDTFNPYFPFRQAQALPGPPKPVLQTDSTSFWLEVSRKVKLYRSCGILSVDAEMTDFSSLYQKYAQDVFRFAYFLSGNQADAEDIVSEAFVRAWNAPGVIRQSTVKAYLLVIARNCYLQGLRHQGRHLPLEQDVSDPRQAPHDSAEQRAELAYVTRDLQQLPEVDRTALLLSAVEEFSYEEIAETLGLSLGAVKTKIHRARLKLLQAREQRR